jgi:hypothetical protein
MARSIVKPDYVTFDSLLTNRLFRIPDYQRAYSWREKQRMALFDDIRNLKKNGDDESDHFLATIVLMATKQRETFGPEVFRVFDVVDGQQRLTTLIILLKSIAKALSASTGEEQRYGVDLQDLLVKRNNNQLVLLQTNHDSAADFRNYLTEGKIREVEATPTTAHRNMASAFRECEAFVAQWPHGATDLLRLVKHQLSFVNYVLEDQGAAYTIFEVLNSRGLPVDALDKCKSMMMAMLYEGFRDEARFEHQSEMQKLWTRLYSEIGIDDVPGTDVLRFSAALLSDSIQGKVLSDDEALAAIRSRYAGAPHELLKAVGFFCDVAQSLKRLQSLPQLSAVSGNRQSRLLYVAICRAQFTPADRERVLDIWERVTFLIYGIFRQDARYEVGELVKLAWRIVNQPLSAKEAIDAFKAIGLKYIDQKRPIANELMSQDCYSNWSDEARYLFFKYEQHLAKQAGIKIPTDVWERIWSLSASKSLEHILPQNVDAAGWSGKFGKREAAKALIHNLGNLMILPLEANSQAADLAFGAKAKIYADHRYLRQVAEVAVLADWTPQTLQDRETALADWAEKYWSLSPA